MSILVVGPSWVGDMVMAQSLFKQLKRQYPNTDVDVIAPPWSLPILARMPEVREAIPLEVGHGEGGLKKRYQLGKSLRHKNYQQAIVLPRSLKAALVPFFAKIPIRTGFKGEQRYGLLNDIRPFDKKVLDQTVKRFTFLGLPKNEKELDLVQPTLTIHKNNIQACLENLNLDKSKYTAVFMPGAEYGPAKQWPAEHFAKLATLIAQSGGQVWILGSNKDNAIAEEIVSLSKQSAINLCGKTKLEDVVDLIAYADVAVTNDSGLMHIASAVNTQVIAIYGSSSPEFTPPLTDIKNIHWLKLDCAPCFKRTCPLGHYNCLKGISSEHVFKDIQHNI